ncbi:hypothetical protein Pla110_24360 [Polystyrenella longa]|uniref:Uncharacterized protein n=1 Tax=Polystyrenella longa TaxID=2528007 RepID=A0A518CND3_9PLAN|nr:hypothetical protein [Polystyrenella longa]QDU80704.1 hypothetical protein Pla110_24360 [Polystyrenella longa]
MSENQISEFDVLDQLLPEAAAAVCLKVFKELWPDNDTDQNSLMRVVNEQAKAVIQGNSVKTPGGEPSRVIFNSPEYQGLKENDNYSESMLAIDPFITGLKRVHSSIIWQSKTVKYTKPEGKKPDSENDAYHYLKESLRMLKLDLFHRSPVVAEILPERIKKEVNQFDELLPANGENKSFTENELNSFLTN